MQLPTNPAELLRIAQKDKLRRAAEGSLIEFTRQAWHIIEPDLPFVDNWHLHVVAEHLEAVSSGEIENLLINVPPGTMKSILVSVMYPAWEWIAKPSLRVMGASYGEDIAIRDALKCRDIITSDWYTENWPHVAIRTGDDQKKKYALTSGGWRMATSVGGRATGEHPDLKLVDDPHSAAQAESDAERETAIQWFDRTLSTRGKSRGAKTIVVMQRLHEKDITGHIVDDIGGYEQICIPMEYDGVRRQTKYYGVYDPRTAVGELMWPDLFDRKKVDDLKRSLGDYASAGQLQQQPAPSGGGIIKVDKFQLWPSDRELPPFEHIVQCYDTAFTKATQNDPTACMVWGVFTHRGAKCAMIVDVWAERMEYPQLVNRVIDDWASKYGGDTKSIQNRPRRADLMLIEEKGSGISLIQDLRQRRLPVRPYNPGSADKVARVHVVTPLLDAEVLYVLESKKNRGRPVSWAEPFLREAERFPNAEHDDMVDVFSMGLRYLKDAGFFDLRQAPERDPDEHRMIKKATRENPYGA